MKPILVLGADGTDREKIAKAIADFYKISCFHLREMALKQSSKPIEDWEYLDYSQFGSQALAELDKKDELCVVHTALLKPQDTPSDPMIPLISYPPSPAQAIISVEAPLSVVKPRISKTLDETKLVLYHERQWQVRLAETCSIPMLTLTDSSHKDIAAILAHSVPAFLDSLKCEILNNNTDPTEGQEIQCSVYESAPEVQQEMMDWLIGQGISRDRIAYSWDTWIGVYFHPPMDEPRWTPEEFQSVFKLLKKHTNVMNVDIPEQGRLGMARSTG